MKFERFSAAMQRTGRSESSGWEDINAGTMPKPVRVGRKANAYPDYEIDAIIKARLAGLPDGKLRELVNQLHELRESSLSVSEIVARAKWLQEVWIPENAQRKAA